MEDEDDILEIADRAIRGNLPKEVLDISERARGRCLKVDEATKIVCYCFLTRRVYGNCKACILRQRFGNGKRCPLLITFGIKSREDDLSCR